MSWAKLDDCFADHPKFAGLSLAAVGLWACGLAYCSRHLTDGEISKKMLHRISPEAAPAASAAELVAAGIWHDVGDRYEVHDYLKYNPSRAKVLAQREADAERKRPKQAAHHVPPSGWKPAGLLPEVSANPSLPSRPVPSQITHTSYPSSLDPSQADPPARVADTVPDAEVWDVEPSDLDGLDRSPETLAIFAALRSHPQLRDVADLGFAETLEGRRMASGRSVEALVCAIGEAAADTPRGETTPTTLKRVRTYCDRARAPKPEAASGAADSGWVLALWSETYAASVRRYGPYVPADDDGEHAAKLGAHAEGIASQEAATRAGGAVSLEALARELVRHWAVNYLREDGVKNHTAESRHPLRLLMRGVPTFGLPSSWRKRAKPMAPRDAPKTEPAVPPPPEFLAALGKLASGMRPTAGENVEAKRRRLQAQAVEVERKETG